jgi:hypothetical protein
VRRESDHGIPAEGSATRGAELLLSGAGSPGPTCIYFGGEQAVVLSRQGRFVLCRFGCDRPVLIPVEEVVWG